MRRAGSGAWAGLLNTHFWVDPTSGVTGAIYTQFLPFVTPEGYQVYVDFEKAVYAALQSHAPGRPAPRAVPERSLTATTRQVQNCRHRATHKRLSARTPRLQSGG